MGESSMNHPARRNHCQPSPLFERREFWDETLPYTAVFLPRWGPYDLPFPRIFEFPVVGPELFLSAKVRLWSGFRCDLYDLWDL